MTWPLDELEADKGDTSPVVPFDDETRINTLKWRVPRLASSRLPPASFTPDFRFMS